MILRFSALVLGLLLVLPGTGAAAYDKDYIGEMEEYRAEYEDTLVHLARDNGLGFVEIRAANPNLDPWIPGDGARVVLPKQHLLPEGPRSGIVINLPEMRLYYYGDGSQEPISYSIGIGREGLRTPMGKTTVTRKVVGPTWTPTDRMRREDPELKPFYPPGPNNPMGSHALYLGFPHIAIHGTDKPYAIGRRVSSGCIRMYPEGIRDLYPRVDVGTRVSVIDQPVKVGWIGDRMYIEVHPSQEQSSKVEHEGELKSYKITAEDMKRITRVAGDRAEQIDWQAVRDAVRAHSGYPVAVLDVNRAPRPEADAHLQELLQEARSKDAAVIEVRAPAHAAANIIGDDVQTIQVAPDTSRTGPSVRYNFNN